MGIRFHRRGYRTICYYWVMKKMLLSGVVVGVLLLSGCSTGSSLDEAESLGGEFVDVVCELGSLDEVTQTYLDELTALADKYDAAKSPEVSEDNKDNAWIQFDTLSGALNDRADALKVEVGTAIDADWKVELDGQCGFVKTSYKDTFDALN